MDWGFISTVLAIIFFITTIFATVIIALRFAKKKQPVWACKTTKIIGLGTNASPELKLTFNGRPVNEVYQTTFILFNKGKEPIRQGDVTANVTICFEGAEILREPTIKAVSNEAIRLSAKQVVKGRANSIELSFLYLDYEDGAVVDVIHTASEQLHFVGNIIGVKDIVNIGDLERSHPLLSGRGVLGWAVSAGIAASVAGFSTGWYTDKGTSAALATLVISGAVCLGILGGAIFILALPHKFPKWSGIGK